MNKIVFSSILIVLLMIFNACTKLPEKVESPAMKISIVVNNNAEEYLVKFSGGLENANSSTVLKNIKGTISIVGNDGSLVAMPYEIEKILPFSIGIIDTEKKVAKDEIVQLAGLFSINQDELNQAKESDTIYVDENKIEFTLDSYEKENIVKLLKGIIHEEKK